MGSCTEEDILTDLEHLEHTLCDLGWQVESGAGPSRKKLPDPQMRMRKFLSVAS
jgi:hypothetical protein